MNTIYVLGLPRAKQVGLEHAKQPKQPAGPIRSSIRYVRVLFICLSPFHELDFEAYLAPTSLN